MCERVLGILGQEINGFKWNVSLFVIARDLAKKVNLKALSLSHALRHMHGTER